MNRKSIVLPLLALTCCLGLATESRADGGVVRLRAEDESLVATVFAPTDPRRDAAIDFTVLVQDRSNAQVILDAVVSLQFVPPVGAPMVVVDPWCRPPRSTLLASGPGGAGALPPIRLSHAQAENKLLCGASVIFPAAGEWRMRLIVQRANSDLKSETSLSIGESTSRLAVVWPWLALPPFAIGLFALNQRLRFRPEAADH